MTTIKDVAARAGVGVGTVSRVLNGHPAVTDETRARVEAAMAVLDYHPSSAARALSRRRSNTIAVAVPFVASSSAVERLRGVLSVLHHTTYDLVLFDVEEVARRPVQFGKLARRDVADGVLLVSLRPTLEEARRLRERGIPTVVVDAEAEPFCAIVVDNVEGGRMAGRHLLSLGHRRIAFVGDVVEPGSGFTSSARRRQGLAEALHAAGVRLDRSLVREGPHDRSVAAQQAVELLQGRKRPTAIFAHSDHQALGVLEGVASLGVAVPDELSVMGFDDVEAAAYAGLTTVRQPLFESGRMGATRLLDLLATATAPRPERIVLPLELVARRTTGPAPPTRAHRPRPAGSHDARPAMATLARSAPDRVDASSQEASEPTNQPAGPRPADP